MRTMFYGADRFTSQVKFCCLLPSNAWQVWRLIPVEVEGVDAPLQPSSEAFGLGLPPYDQNEPGRSSSYEQHVGSERDDFGTVVTEITITRKKYRVDG